MSSRGVARKIKPSGGKDRVGSSVIRRMSRGAGASGIASSAFEPIEDNLENFSTCLVIQAIAFAEREGAHTLTFKHLEAAAESIGLTLFGMGKR